ncbi:MAG TPA: PHP domain-containing protein, partial [Nitrosopumilaceae archaeon]|nr:PHP domain-containing protein [Nitrosopumilaceae archaeon]
MDFDSKFEIVDKNPQNQKGDAISVTNTDIAPLNNNRIAQILDNTGELLKMEGEENIFRIQAYHNAAHSIRGIKHDLSSMDRMEIAVIKGIGTSMSMKVYEIINTGTLSQLEELKKTRPNADSILGMTRVRGIGAKTAFKIYEEHGIKSFIELTDAVIKKGLLPQYKQAVQFALKESISGYLWTELKSTVEHFLSELKQQPGVLKADVVGSFRRGKPFVNDLDLLVAVDGDASSIHSYFCKLGEAVLASGEQKSSISYSLGLYSIQIDLLTVPLSEYGSALCYFTGSKTHNAIIRGYARKSGLTVNEHGIYKIDTNERVGGEYENDLYCLLDLPFCPPELREEKFDLLKILPDSIGEIIQDLHIHSLYSDGSKSIADMIMLAKSHGLTTIGISDHIAKSVYGYKMLDLEIFNLWLTDIDKAKTNNPNLTILKGAEIDLDKEGN